MSNAIKRQIAFSVARKLLQAAIDALKGADLATNALTTELAVLDTRAAFFKAHDAVDFAQVEVRALAENEQPFADTFAALAKHAGKAGL